jgi:hypothetical protein
MWKKRTERHTFCILPFHILKKHLFYKRLHVQDSIVLSNIKLPVCKNNSFRYLRRISYSTIIISFYLRDLAVPSFYVAEISPYNQRENSVF